VNEEVNRDEPRETGEMNLEVDSKDEVIYNKSSLILTAHTHETKKIKKSKQYNKHICIFSTNFIFYSLIVLCVYCFL